MSNSKLKLQKFKQKLKENVELYNEYKDKDRKRKQEIRENEKIERLKNKRLMLQWREKERKRKYKQRQRKVEKRKKEGNVEKIDGRTIEGLKRRRKNDRNKIMKIKSLTENVSTLTKENLRLKKKLEILKSKTADSSISSFTSTDTRVASTIWKNLSPSSRKKSSRKIILSNNDVTIKKEFRKHLGIRLDRATDSLGKKDTLANKVTKFMVEDKNSIKCPDKKKENLRYRTNYLHVLHEKFLCEYNLDCSYSHFCKLVPDNIIKPKPQDWGTCLCMVCLNPQLKMEALRQFELSLFVETEELITYSDKELKEFVDKIKIFTGPIRYLYWSKDKKDSEKSVATTYMSSKKVKISSCENFATALYNDIKELSKHTERMISQYRRIKEIKLIVCDEKNKSMCIRVDWSENANLFQTRQEKGSYYHNIYLSVNAVVSYQGECISSHGTLSDATSHHAPAVWASLEKILEPFNLQQLSHLYIISDSPVNQYRNKNNAFLTKRFAVKNKIDITWVFTESGHGKGPMDGVGSSIKNDIQDTISFNPNNVITCVSELMPLMPINDKNLSTYCQDDIDALNKLLPKDVKIITKGFGIRSVHEIMYTLQDNDEIQWKIVSEDKSFTTVHFSMTKVNKNSNTTAEVRKDVRSLRSQRKN